MAKSEGPSIWNFVQQTRRVGHTEHTRNIIPWIGRTCEWRWAYNICIQFALKFYYRLGMAKSEGPSIWNFVHQRRRVGHTEHTRTIIPWIGCTCEWRWAFIICIQFAPKFYYRLGMAKSEGPSIWNFMHQTLRVGHTEHTRTIIPRIGCTCEWRWAYNICIQFALK